MNVQHCLDLIDCEEFLVTLDVQLMYIPRYHCDPIEKASSCKEHFPRA